MKYKSDLQELGVFDAKADFERAVKARVDCPKRVQGKPRVQQPEGEIRRSGRARAAVSRLYSVVTLLVNTAGKAAESVTAILRSLYMQFCVLA